MSIKSNTGQLGGGHVKNPVSIDDRPQDEKDWEKSLIMERIHAIYEEPIISVEKEHDKEMAIKSLFARKRKLEI